jgi:hypothetical protein
MVRRRDLHTAVHRPLPRTAPPLVRHEGLRRPRQSSRLPATATRGTKHLTSVLDALAGSDAGVVCVLQRRWGTRPMIDQLPQCTLVEVGCVKDLGQFLGLLIKQRPLLVGALLR